ncbi:hypothetical protein SAMN05421786_102550 [Chryseobacterium ureilyticum]|uniref:Uncharacterized protein n=1 Tax=Chryseobacterium ureilyticum TaxID=373668 RepID=A0A1N7MFU4_9FLAO|nr:hypothetical protein [Chryseobacterium ureilyticum]SIS84912.1 hypothetical protein SAMN05421786_102550 [Chryseobacterium ureilyticum]
MITLNKLYDKIHDWLLPMPEQECDMFPPVDHLYSTSFQKVVMNYLKWYGVNKKGNTTSSKVYPTFVETLETKNILRKCGFTTGEYIEKLVIYEFLEMKERMPDLNPVMFAHFFEDSYHNSKLVKFTSLEVQKLNQNTKEYYDKTRRFLIEIQGYLKVSDLRIRIECIHTENKNWFNHSRVQEFITPFCKLALNCNELGRFSITYFINPHFKEFIGESLANTLEKQFNELANSEIKDLVKMTPLNRRYDKWFKQIQSIPNYKVTITEQNLL